MAKCGYMGNETVAGVCPRMKKCLPFITALFIFACGTSYQPQTLAITPSMKASSAAAIIQQPTETPMPTLTPLPTIDYRATDQAYQLAMEAERNDMIKVQLAHDELMMDKQIELARIGATQTYQPTAIALTGAQMTLSAGQLTLGAGQLTATAQVPTRMAQIIQLQNIGKYAEFDRLFKIGFLSVVALFLLAISYFVVRWQPPMKMDVEEEEQNKPNGFDVTLRDEKNPGRSEHFHLPCSEEQLTELAEMVMNGKRTFAYNRMETKSRTFRGQSGREMLEQVRDVLNKAHLTDSTLSGEDVVNDRGVQFFTQWFETHELPDGFEIATPSPEVENG